jgi:hypothetical protein
MLLFLVRVLLEGGGRAGEGGRRVRKQQTVASRAEVVGSHASGRRYISGARREWRQAVVLLEVGDGVRLVDVCLRR